MPLHHHAANGCTAFVGMLIRPHSPMDSAPLWVQIIALPATFIIKPLIIIIANPVIWFMIQKSQGRLAVIVDEYGEVQGPVGLDDIIEKMVGEFTTSTPGATRAANACSREY